MLYRRAGGALLASTLMDGNHGANAAALACTWSHPQESVFASDLMGMDVVKDDVRALWFTVTQVSATRMWQGVTHGGRESHMRAEGWPCIHRTTSTVPCT